MWNHTRWILKSGAKVQSFLSKKKRKSDYFQTFSFNIMNYYLLKVNIELNFLI